MKNRIIAITVLIVVGLLILAPMASAQMFYFNNVQSLLSTSNTNFQWNYVRSDNNAIQQFNNIFNLFSKNFKDLIIDQPVDQPEIEQPKEPEQPSKPWLPEEPNKPEQPSQPWLPEQPKEPEQPSKPWIPEEPNKPEQPENGNGSNGIITSEETKMLEYINNERAKAGVGPLKMDFDLARLAKLKSQDMVDKNYFSHTSPTYGSPFEMMNSYGIKYRTAGENIARNSTMSNAHTALMNSEGHRNNILNPNFTHIGIGIVKNQISASITVTQMFIGK